MRVAFSVTLVLVGLGVGLAGCSGSNKDDTPNQMAQASSYPAGPYGYLQGSVIQNITFLGKNASNDLTAPAYDSMKMEEISLSDFHSDPSVKYVVLSGVAGWCGPCNAEQDQMPDVM